MYRGPAEERVVACSACGARIERSEATFSPAGETICRRCDAAQRVTTSTANAGKSALYSALAALGLGLLSVPCNLFFIFSVMAITGGIVSLKLCLRPEFRAAFGTLFPWTVAAAVAAIVFGAVQPVFWASVTLLGAVSGLGH